MKKLYTFILIIIVATAAAQSQRTLLHLHGAGNHVSESAHAQAIDADGNIVITGTAANDSGSYVLTQKYSPSGTLLWTRTLKNNLNGKGNDLETDQHSNIYVVARTSDTVGYSEVRVIKYGPTGKVQWMTSFPDTMAYWGYPCKIDLDNDENIYVAGRMNNNNLHVLKYSNSGQLLWHRRFPPTVSYWTWKGRTSMIVDNNGDVYIAGGIHYGNSNTRLSVAKYSSSGNLLWVAQDNGDMQWMDDANDLALDQQGNVYVTGREEYHQQANNFATLKYDPNGNLIWKKTYNNPSSGGDDPYDVMISADGSVYVTGIEDRYTPSLEPYGGTTIKYDSNGNELWKITLGDTNERYVACYIAEDVSKNIYLAGYYIYEHTWIASTWTRGVFAARLSPTGTVLWMDTMLVQRGASATGINIHPAGGAYVSASLADTTSDPGGYAYFNLALIRYGTDAVGNSEIENTLTGVDLFPNPASSMVTIDAGANELLCAEIYDMSGRKVQCVNVKSNERVDISHLQAGAYMVRFTAGDKVGMKKLLVVR